MKFIFLLVILATTMANAQMFGPPELAHFDLAKDRVGRTYEPIAVSKELTQKVTRSLTVPREQREIEVSDDQGNKRRFVGFVLPGFQWLYGTSSGDGEVRYPNYNHRVDDEKLPSIVPDSEDGGGAVIVPTCRNPQGTLTMDDPMNRREVSCFPSLMIFRRL